MSARSPGNDLAADPPVPVPRITHSEELIPSRHALEEDPERRIDEIELIGEEEAAGFRQPGRSDVSPAMRYLHASRTIHQLITDRNRAVGLYIAVMSLLWTASGAMLNAKPAGPLIVPIESVQRWCIPVTCAALAVLAAFTAFLLIRTRIGLIYEVAKMNVLLGLPVGRVKRINPLSIFFIMHVLVSVLGGAFAALFTYHLFRLSDPNGAGQMAASAGLGAGLTVLLIALYIGLVLNTTLDHKLSRAANG